MLINRDYASEGGGNSCFRYNIDILRGPVATKLNSAKTKLTNAISIISALPDLTEIAGIKSNSARIEEIQNQIDRAKSNALSLITELYDLERENEKKINELAVTFGIDTGALSFREVLEALALELKIDTNIYVHADNFSDLQECIPYINQLEYGDVRYGSTSIQKGGCCPSSYSMMVAIATR